MSIACNELSQVASELLMAFQDCNKVKNSDLRKLVELVMAVSECSNGGPLYNVLITDVHEPTEDKLISYPSDSFHAVSVMVVNGTISYSGVTLPQGSVINIEFTTLNQLEFKFTAHAFSKIVVEYLIEELPE